MNSISAFPFLMLILSVITKERCYFWWKRKRKMMPRSHLHVKLSRCRATNRNFMKWRGTRLPLGSYRAYMAVMGYTWLLWGLHGCYGSTWRLLEGCHIMDLLHMDIHPRVNEFIHALMNSCTCHCQKCHKSISDMLSLFDPHDRHRQLAGRGIWT